MSDKYLNLLEKELDRLHAMLDTQLPEDDEYWWTLQQIERVLTVLCPHVQTEAQLQDLLEGAPAPDEVM